MINEFYNASELFDDNLSLLEIAIVKVRIKKEDKPIFIRNWLDKRNHKRLYKYCKRICDMKTEEYKRLKEECEKELHEREVRQLKKQRELENIKSDLNINQMSIYDIQGV